MRCEMFRPIIYKAEFPGSRGGMGSPARLLGPAYWPGFVTVVFGVNAASVSRSEKWRKAKRTSFVCHRPLRVCPSLLLQSAVAFFTSRLEHRYAASFRSVYMPSSVLPKIRPASMYRFSAAAITRVSVGLPSFFNPSEISAAESGLFSFLRMTLTWNGMLSSCNPVAFLLRRFGTSSPSFFRADSSSLIFFLWSSMAASITWAASLMSISYPNNLFCSGIGSCLSRIPGCDLGYGIGSTKSSWNAGNLVAA